VTFLPAPPPHPLNVSKISTFFWLQTKIPKINTGNQNHIFQVEKMQKFTPKTTWVGEEKGTSSMIIHPSKKKKKKKKRF